MNINDNGECIPKIMTKRNEAKKKERNVKYRNKGKSCKFDIPFATHTHKRKKEIKMEQKRYFSQQMNEREQRKIRNGNAEKQVTKIKKAN